MEVLKSIGNGLVAVLGGVGVVILYVVVLVTLPLWLAGIAVDYMLFRPGREAEIRNKLTWIQDSMP